MERAYLTLENGQVFEGRRFGAATQADGELVFTTSMTGYLETLTDPRYHGQIVVQTFPLIGNYGVIPQELGAHGPSLSGYIVREWCEAPSNWRSTGTLDAYLRAQGVCGLCGIDTRRLTRMLRTEGVMRAHIADTPAAAFGPAAPDTGAPLEAGMPQTHTPADAVGRVALWDFGAGAAVLPMLLDRKLEACVFPAGTEAAQILDWQPNGIVLSGGPGDPAALTGPAAQVGMIARRGIPLLGVGLGHQLLALARGARTYKLKFGHRGANQPARDLQTGRIYITSQNHGYAVALDDLPAGIEAGFVNANDQSCEGLLYRDIPALSIQFDPQAGMGPSDTGFVWDAFLRLMGRDICH